MTPGAQAWAGVGCVVVAALALTLPFLGMPLHMDDDIYLKGAEQILREPWNPLGGTQKMLGADMPTYHFTQHPPLVSYYIALILVVGGDAAAWRLHLAFLLFPVVAGLGVYSLARRFVRHPLLATLLCLVTPAFLVSSHSLMTDVPFLAFWLAATAAFVRVVDGSGRLARALPGVFLALAVATQYRALLLVPLLLAYAALQRKGLRAWVWASLPALTLLVGWSLWNRATLGIVHLADAGAWIPFTAERVLRDSLAYVSFVGGATVFPLFGLYAVRRALARTWTWLALGSLGPLLAWRWASDHVGLQRVLLLVFFAGGLAMLLALAPSRARLVECARALPRMSMDAESRDGLFLLLMAGAALASQVVVNLFASVRSLLVAVPFLVLLLVRQLERERATPRRAQRTLTCGIGLTLAMGVAVAVADQRYAAASERLARRVGDELRADGRVWFTGEWGFRHYMEAQGFRYLTSADNSPRAGDLVVVPDLPCPSDLNPELVHRLRLKATLESGDHCPVKVVSFRDHAAFHSDFFGLLPYSFSARALFALRVFEVEGPR